MKNFFKKLPQELLMYILSYIFCKKNNYFVLYSNNKNNSIVNTSKYFYPLKDKYFYFIFNQEYSLKYLNDLEFRKKIKNKITTTKQKIYINLNINNNNIQNIKLDDVDNVDSVSLYITSTSIEVYLSNINNVYVSNSYIIYFKLYNINYLYFDECKSINLSEFDDIIKLELSNSSLLDINESCNLKTLESLNLYYSYISKTIDENILRNLFKNKNLEIKHSYIIDIYNFGGFYYDYIQSKIDILELLKRFKT